VEAVVEALTMVVLVLQLLVAGLVVAQIMLLGLMQPKILVVVEAVLEALALEGQGVTEALASLFLSTQISLQSLLVLV
jgi:hypothetical protein